MLLREYIRIFPRRRIPCPHCGHLYVKDMFCNDLNYM